MLRVYSKFLTNIFRLLDIGVIIISFVIGGWLYDIIRSKPLTPLSHIFKLFSIEMIIYALVWIYISSDQKLYYSRRMTPIYKEVEALIKASFFPFAFILIGNLGLNFPNHHYDILVIVWISNLTLMILLRICLRKMLRFIRAKGFDYRNILIVGRNKRSSAIIRRISDEEAFGLKMVGYVDEPREISDSTKYPENIKCLGNLNSLIDILNSNIIDEVFITLPIKSFYERMEDIIGICTRKGVGVRIVSDLFYLKDMKNSTIDRLDNIPLLNISFGPDDIFKLFLKRCLDVLISSSLLIITAPFLLFVSLLIRLDSPGPVLFIQERVSCNNRRFKLLKFRTMMMNAEDKKSELMKMNEMDGPVFKIKNDPRITRVGRYLRRFSIDELPQLINVFKGEMSLVGPRPPTPDEVEKYSWGQKRRLSVKPGITCLWQVRGRNKIPFAEWVNMDLEYIDKWTLTMDFKILLKTIIVVFSGKGM